MAPRPKQATPPSTSVPAKTGDPNQPDLGFSFTVSPDQVSTEAQAGSEQFSVLYQEFFDQAFGELRAMPLERRRRVLGTLYKKGFGSDSEVSPDGLDTNDIDRYRSLLVYGFVRNRTADEILRSDFAKNDLFPDVRTGGARKLTPVADVDRVFKDVVRSQLGRAPRADEMEKFRRGYAALESGDNAPSVTAAAEQQVSQQFSGEQRATRFAGYMDVFDQLLRGA